MNKAKQDMEEVLSLAKDDINSVQVGRAKPSVVEEIKVTVYGSRMRLKELASISAPDPHSLLVKPWDTNILEDIQKGIQIANLGLNPVVDSTIIRISIPPLTSEQRQEKAKLVDQKAESAKVMARQVRTASKEEIEGKKGSSGVSEDDIHLSMIELQKITDEYISQITQFAENRKKEITTL